MSDMKSPRIFILSACLFLASLFLPGCAGSMGTPADRCATASALYEAYLASTTIREVSKDETAAAAAAALVLRLQCGWVAAKPGDVAPAYAPSGGKLSRAAVPLYRTNSVGEIELRTGVPVLLPEARARYAPQARPTKVPTNDPDHLHVTLSGGGSVALPAE